jgi:C4-dicarboxylate-specific signal transduction histidine kinase
VIQRLRDLLGKHNLERKVFDLNDVVRELESIMRAEARRRSVALEIKRAPEAVAIMGDRVQIQQVLINLVLNAMDAVADQPEARRAVSVTVEQGESGAVLTVRDRGQGIAPEHQARVFESFFTTKPSGMGLGLSISRTIVEAHGGRVWADSDSVEGTVFRAELPLAAATGAS